MCWRTARLGGAQSGSVGIRRSKSSAETAAASRPRELFREHRKRGRSPIASTYCRT
jgi:hypothetical protein